MTSVAVSQACRESYPWMKFGYCCVRGLSTHTPLDSLAGERAEVEAFVRGNVAALRERAKSISRFYRTQGERNRSHIESLIGAIANGGRMKPVNFIVDAVMLSEMRNALPLGVHDLRRIEGEIVLDVASDGETFVGIGDRLVSTRPNEVVLRDGLGVWASYTQGPDARTLVGADTVDVIVLGFFTPETPSELVTRGLEDAVGILASIGGTDADPVIIVPR